MLRKTDTHVGSTSQNILLRNQIYETDSLVEETLCYVSNNVMKLNTTVSQHKVVASGSGLVRSILGEMEGEFIKDFSLLNWQTNFYFSF